MLHPACGGAECWLGMAGREGWWPAQGESHGLCSSARGSREGTLCEAGPWGLGASTAVMPGLGCGGKERSRSSYSRTQESAWQWLEGEGQDVSQRQQEFIHLVLSLECLQWVCGRTVSPPPAAWLMELCPTSLSLCRGHPCSACTPWEMGLAGEEPPEQVVRPA